MITTKKYTYVLLIFMLLLPPSFLVAQVDPGSIILNRGKLWTTISIGKSGPAFANWTKRGIGLDWPGFDPSTISENIGGSASHLLSGGIYVGAKKHPDSVLSVDEWSMYSGSISTTVGTKYVVTKNQRVYGNGGNDWLQANPDVGEDYIETVWEYNTAYEDSFNIERMLPVRVTRRVHQWSGSQADENYIIFEYIIKNISEEIRQVVPPEQYVADTLYDFYTLVNYGMHVNSRSWEVLFPSLSPGARNTWFNYDRRRQVVYGYAADYPETPEKNEELGYSASFGLTENGSPTGEYLAPAHVGFKLLYSTPNKDGQESYIRQQGWSAASNSIDLSGPFTNIGSLEAQYTVMDNIELAANFVDSWTDTLFMKRSRMWSMMSLGPWDILPGDSIHIVVAEIVNGVDYDKIVHPDQNPTNLVISEGRKLFFETCDRAQLTFDNNFNHPDPPAAPDFEVDFFKEADVVANVITWNTSAENIPDPDYGVNDIAGYILYRSGFLPIGPYEPIDTIDVGDPYYLTGMTYTYVDSVVEIGQGYYYALTSFDTGHDSWPVNPSQIFPETGSNAVPQLESSIYANRLRYPFIATLSPKDDLDEVLVVPNPFVLGEGFSQPGGQDQIQFVNVPNPCTIRIYTIRGDHLKTIEVETGQGAIVPWDQTTDYGQFVESGVYIFHIESASGEKIGKFSIVR